MTASVRFITSHPNIIVCGAEQAQALCDSASTRAALYSVLSIADPPPFKAKRPRPGLLSHVTNLCTLNFRDTDDPTLENCPNMETIVSILRFGELTRTARPPPGPNGQNPGPYRTMIHCAAGRSRSTAAAFIILCARLGPSPTNAPVRHERQAMTQLLTACERAPLPNMLMCKLADDYLGRGGALVQVAQHQNDFPEDAEADGNKPVTGTALLAAIRRGDL